MLNLLVHSRAGVGKGAAVHVCCSMHLGLSPVHTVRPGKGRSEQDCSAVAIRTEVQIVVGYGLVFQILLRELLAFV